MGLTERAFIVFGFLILIIGIAGMVLFIGSRRRQSDHSEDFDSADRVNLKKEAPKKMLKNPTVNDWDAPTTGFRAPENTTDTDFVVNQVLHPSAESGIAPELLAEMDNTAPEDTPVWEEEPLVSEVLSNAPQTPTQAPQSEQAPQPPQAAPTVPPKPSRAPENVLFDVDEPTPTVSQQSLEELSTLPRLRRQEPSPTIETETVVENPEPKLANPNEENS